MTEEDKLFADKLRNRALADYERLDLAINELERQATRPTARWERLVDDFKKCSKCGMVVKSYRNYKYCPECGAKMQEEEE